MFLRFSQTLLIYFLLFSYVESAESGGMPQLNPEFWFSQIFWLIITFGIMFILLSKFVLPKISENLELRKAQISENIEVLTNLIGIPKIIEQAAVAGVLNEQQIYNIEAAEFIAKRMDFLSGFSGLKRNR